MSIEVPAAVQGQRVLATDADLFDGQAVPTACSPTRRRLLALIAALPTIDHPAEAGAGAGAGAGAQGRDRRARQDPLLRLFAEFRARVVDHERALRRCDEFEAALVAEHSYPRVRLPGATDAPARYAADAGTITRKVPPGRRRNRLHHILGKRQRRWDEAAFAKGLTQSQVREATSYRAVRAAADTLFGTPSRTPQGILLKLLVLLSLEEPNEAFRNASPWRELHLILANLHALAADT